MIANAIKNIGPDMGVAEINNTDQYCPPKALNVDKSRKTVDKECELGKTHSFVRISKNLAPPDLGGI